MNPAEYDRAQREIQGDLKLERTRQRLWWAVAFVTAVIAVAVGLWLS